MNQHPPRTESAARAELHAAAADAAAAGEAGATPGLEFVDELPALAARLRQEVAKVIVGQDLVIDEVLVTLLCGGHVLLEGVPGLAKTLLVNSISSALSLTCGRIQFTPDLMPADVTGSTVAEEVPGTRERRFVFRRGAIFVNTLLADEINRSPPKTQAALLEGMAEGRVTAAGSRYRLPDPFFVLATQNPIEQEGTYPLPEAQLDRFLMKVLVEYPAFEEEADIMRRTTGELTATTDAVLSREEVLSLRAVVRALPVSRHVLEYATRLVRQSRPDDDAAPDWVPAFIVWGAGPRAAQALVLAAKAHTLLDGRFSVTRSDVQTVAAAVLRHRIVPSFRADAEGQSVEAVVHRLIYGTSSLPTQHRFDETTRKILRL